MSQAIGVEKQVMVLGSTSEAEWVAQGLLELGYKVHWIAPDASMTHVPSDPRLAFYPHGTLVGLDGHVGSFSARFQHDGQAFAISATALIVATGNERYYPLDAYGLALSSKVVTVSQIERQLAAPRTTGAALPHRNQRVIVLLDRSGETSKETATEALQIALRLRREWHCEVNVFYQNLKVDTYGLELLTRQMRDRGIVFCRYAEPKIVITNDGVDLTYVEGMLHGDLLVLPEAVRPRGDTAALAGLLRVRIGEDGYFQDINIRQYRPGISVRRGIFFTGRCHLDAGAEELRADATQAVANVAALLGDGALRPDEVIAHVDSSKCVRCLTCVRSCPHAAVEIADYDDVTAARVVDLACQGCGACVANCPVRAIELVGQVLPAWMQSVAL